MNENLEKASLLHGGCLYEPGLGLEAQYFIIQQ